MRAWNEAEWLLLWEQGAQRHPIDRALLLCAAAREDLEPSSLADLPIGVVHAMLLQLRREMFGGTIRAYAICPACGGRLELFLEVESLLAAGREAPGVDHWEDSGLRVRLPTSRDLAAVSGESDPERAASELFRRCCTSGIEDDRMAALLPHIEAGLDALDPLASVEIAAACAACERTSNLGLDVGALLWEEIAAGARMLIGEVHVLASAYGWPESEILALSRQRRAVYLERVLA